MYVEKITAEGQTYAEKYLAAPVNKILPNSASLQGKFSHSQVSQVSEGRDAVVSSQMQNPTGLPDRLKCGLEHLSGYDLSAVRVHYNSPKPKQLGALAYAQGANIHLGEGQESHLPHEGWHVVQQMQGRVNPTMQMKGALINDDEGLEQEADVMGKKALHQAPHSFSTSSQRQIRISNRIDPSGKNASIIRKAVRNSMNAHRPVTQLGISRDSRYKRRKTSKRDKFSDIKYLFQKPLFDTVYAHPVKYNWPRTRSLITVYDYFRHLNNPGSREKFTPQELNTIDAMLAKQLVISIRKSQAESDLLDAPRVMEPGEVPASIVKYTDRPNRRVYGSQLRERLKEHFLCAYEHLLDKFFNANPDIVSKIAWTIPRIHNPFTNMPILKNVAPANNWNSSPIAYQNANIQPLTNAAGRSRIKFKKLTNTSQPSSLKNQYIWEMKGILQDKNKPSQRLTLMHQIRGRFGGPSSQNNMFLGTAASNLSDVNSHVNQVEDRIAWAITSAPKWPIRDFYVEYLVEPQFGTIAPHVQQQIVNANLNPNERNAAIDWCKQATPKHYKTHWVLHVLRNDNQKGIYEEKKTLNADE